MCSYLKGQGHTYTKVTKVKVIHMPRSRLQIAAQIEKSLVSLIGNKLRFYYKYNAQHILKYLEVQYSCQLFLFYILYLLFIL